MPWEIKQNYGGCTGYAVVKEGTTEVEGCHSSRSAAQKQMAALYASETDKAVVTNEVTPNKYPQGIRGSKRKKPMKVINKEDLHSTLTLIKETISSWDKEEVIEKSSSIESDSSEKKEVPEDLSSIFSDMPTHAKRVNTMGNAPISLNLFRGEERGRRNL